MPIQRPVIAVNSSHQFDLFPGGGVIPREVGKPEPSGGVIFKRPDPRERFVCGVRLDDYLTAMGRRDALASRELLQAQKWEVFEARYRPGGRAPYAPEALFGLILYGTTKGISSLRGLEELARLDLGCLWIMGGLCPDHAAIERCIQLHEESISGGFLAALTGTVLKVTGTGVATLAGDGTVVQAAASNYHTIKLKAVVQPQKNKKTFAPSDKPSVLANESRVVVAWQIDPSSELAPVPDLLDQAASLGTLETALFDAG